MGFNIFLNQYKQKKSTKKTMILPVDLEQEAKRYMYENLEGDISQIDIYDRERQACTEIRLNVNVVPVISNVLTNYKTEIVRFEGSDSANSLTYNPVSSTKATSGTDIKTGKEIQWNDITAIRDSQLSRSGLSYSYHCGIDFFSNYHFRVAPTNFKTICQVNGKSQTEDDSNTTYNTIWDYMREYNGENVKDINEYDRSSDVFNLHVFTAEEIMEPADTVAMYQRESNGWYGFKNISKLRAYGDDKNCLDIQAPICNRSANDFIDLTPERDLFNFYPKWNDYRSREEKNWNYCLTYPYSSTTDLSFIRSSTSSLVIASFDEVGNNGYTYYTTVCKHGLKEGDYVNIYSGDDVLLSRQKVIKIGSGTTAEIDLNKDYIFSVKTIDNISDNYLYKDKFDTEEFQEHILEYPLLGIIEGIKDTYGEGSYYTLDGKQAFDSTKEDRTTQIPVPIFEDNWINPDINTLDLSMKKVENGMECNYYVRINAKLPNFNGAMDVIDEYSVQNLPELLEKYSMHSNNLFSNENGRLAFAKTIYNDNMGAVTYTENVPFAYLQNNLKRPLNDIFFTVFKNNKGYKEWYNDNNVTGDTIEYSHVFGKLTCAFELSRASELVMDKEDQPRHKTIHTINNIDEFYEGENISVLNNEYRSDGDDDDEVNWEANRFFYNDVVEYSRAESIERTIQQVQYRFNTAQRELQDKNPFFTGVTFDTIEQDDYDNDFKAGTIRYKNGDTTKSTIDEDGNPLYNLFYQREGYYYQPHYRIPVRTVSATKEKTYSTVVPVRKDSKAYNDGSILLVTRGDNYAELKTKIVLYNSTYDTYFYGVVQDIKATNIFIADLYKDFELKTPLVGDEFNNVIERIQNAPNTFSYIKPNTENASYADFLEDGSFMFQWRAILPNGYDDNDEEVYPFANNYLYVDKKVVFFLRRQWWDRLEKVNVDKFPAERSGQAVNTYVFDEYVEEDDINCLI